MIESFVATWFLLVSAPPLEVEAMAVPHVREDGQKTHRVHLQLDAEAIFAIGGQSALGTELHFKTRFEHWQTRLALGVWDVGAAFTYQNEPTFLAPWIDPNEVDGATHRTRLAATAGHTCQLGHRRRWAIGAHLYGGWNAWRSAYSVDYSAEDVSGDAVVTRHDFVAGGEVDVGYRFHSRVGVNVTFGTPFPTQSSYLITIAQGGLGLSFYLR